MLNVKSAHKQSVALKEIETACRKYTTSTDTFYSFLKVCISNNGII